MNIKQALKLKKKLATKMNREFGKVQSYNSTEEGTKAPYSAKESLQNWLKMGNELVELKTKIHKANAPVYDKIFRMSELKSQLTFIKSLDCTDGKHYDRYSSRENAINKVAEISLLERDAMITSMEEEIEQLQDELDHHNATTSI